MRNEPRRETHQIMTTPQQNSQQENLDQQQHNKWMASQSKEQLQELARSLGNLARSANLTEQHSLLADQPQPPTT